MQALLPSCKSVSLLNFSPPVNFNNSILTHNSILHSRCHKFRSFHLFHSVESLKSLLFSKSLSLWRGTHFCFCSQNDVFDDFSRAQSPETSENDRIQENEELELLDKPSLVSVSNELALEVNKESEKPDKDETLEPFLKFLKPRDSLQEVKEDEGGLGVVEEKSSIDNEDKEEVKNVDVDYYEPKPGEFVVGVVVSGNENKLDVNVGADLLGTLLTKEVLPLYDKEMEYLLCDLNKDAEEFMVKGKMGIVKDDSALSGGPGPGRPVVETGTVLFAEVLGRTLSGRPLLSTRRLFRRIAWHRVRQIKQLNEPIEVKITEWNTGGLLTRIEGLRAFLPKAELMNKVNNFKEMKENVGRCMYVQITRINEANNDLILSEREAWETMNLQEGTVLEGTVKKIFPYGAQVQIGETNRSGLLHVSNISRTRITSVSDLLKVDEKVKVLVVKSMFPGKISLRSIPDLLESISGSFLISKAVSIADLESAPGLFTSNKEKVFAEADEMGKKYRQKLPAVSATWKSEISPSNNLSFGNEATFYANWKWFKFERDNEII